MKIDFEPLTECALRMVAGMEAHPVGSLLLICAVLAHRKFSLTVKKIFRAVT